MIVACRNHPARDAIGVCVRCRARICAECTTKVEGINRCVECLATLARESSRAPSTPAAVRPRWGGRIAAGTMMLSVAALVWALFEMALPR